MIPSARSASTRLASFAGRLAGTCSGCQGFAVGALARSKLKSSSLAWELHLGMLSSRRRGGVLVSSFSFET